MYTYTYVYTYVLYIHTNTHTHTHTHNVYVYETKLIYGPHIIYQEGTHELKLRAEEANTHGSPASGAGEGGGDGGGGGGGVGGDVDGDLEEETCRRDGDSQDSSSSLDFLAPQSPSRLQDSSSSLDFLAPQSFQPPAPLRAKRSKNRCNN